jgi:hypothetical protein
MTEVFGSLDTLARVCYTASVEKGFWADLPRDDASLGPYLGNKIALMHSELSEALEGLRKPGPDQHLPHLSQEAVEMADALIRIFDYCGARGIHIGAAVKEKMDYNATRPHKHGKAF